MIGRARLLFFVALGLAGLILVANFPFGSLLSERATLRSDSAHLAALQAENQQLAAQIRALHDPVVVGEIAHGEYGLTEPGQRAVVVLPSDAKGAVSSGNPLADNAIPAADLLPSDAILDPATPGPTAKAVRGPGFWHQVASSLEFWHSLF